MKRYFLGLLSIITLSFFMTGCIKDKGYDDNEYQSLRENTSDQKIVSVGLTTTLPLTDPEFNVALTPFDNSTTSTVLNLVPIKLSGGVPAEQDVHIVVDTSFAILDAYNQSPNGSFIYEFPAANKYSIVSKTVTIPKGQSIGYLQIRLVPNDLIAGPTQPNSSGFALSVKIISVDGGYQVAAGRSQGIAAFIVNNQYSGDYLSNATRIRYNGPTVASGPIAEPPFTNVNVIKPYTTSGSVSIKGGLGDSGSGVTVNLTIIAGNVITVVPVAGTLAADLGTNISTGGSTYDPATKTYTIHAAYHATSGNLRTVDEVITKQ
jgi:hypothetical protein